MALLFLLAWQQWGQAITQTLNVNIGFGPFTVNLFGWVAEVLDATYNFLLDKFDGLLNPLVNFMLAPIAAIENPFTLIKQTRDHYAAAIGNIALVAIPTTLQAGTVLARDDAIAVYNEAAAYATRLFSNAQF